VRGLGWGNKKSQQRRFRELTYIFKNDWAAHVLDVGCGYGDLLGYLKKRDIKVHYTGMDFMEEMVREARARHPSIMFYRQDVLDRWPFHHENSFDYVVASGIFSHKDYTYLEEVVGKMFGACRKGVAFNCLDDRWQGRRVEDEFYADYREVFEICRRIGAKSMLLSEVYLPNDMTMYMWKDSR